MSASTHQHLAYNYCLHRFRPALLINKKPEEKVLVPGIIPPLLLSASHDPSSKAGMLSGQKAGRKTILLTLLSFMKLFLQ